MRVLRVRSHRRDLRLFATILDRGFEYIQIIKDLLVARVHIEVMQQSEGEPEFKGLLVRMLAPEDIHEMISHCVQFQLERRFAPQRRNELRGHPNVGRSPTTGFSWKLWKLVPRPTRYPA